ncbi:MAG: type 1 glutamine amidotransferase [Acidobacteriota bacterium]
MSFALQVFQHVPFEGAGAVADWAAEKGAAPAVVRWFAGERPEAPPGPATRVVVMGGPMSVHDEAQYPWLGAEKRWLREHLDRGGALLGICLGAQLAAELLGARVYPLGCREVGWFPVRRAPEAEDTAWGRALPPVFPAFHWHGETFDIPAGAVRLAASEACPNQAFVWEDRVLALQFHLEVQPEGARLLCRHCSGDLEPGRWVQSPAEMTDRSERFATAHRLLFRLLDGWFEAMPSS